MLCENYTKGTLLLAVYLITRWHFSRYLSRTKKRIYVFWGFIFTFFFYDFCIHSFSVENTIVVLAGD